MDSSIFCHISSEKRRNDILIYGMVFLFWIYCLCEFEKDIKADSKLH